MSSQVFAGQIGTNELAASALANTWWNLMYYFLLGATFALDTLGSQAYGSQDYNMLATWSLCACVFLSVLSIPFAAALWYSKGVAVVLFGQEEEGPVAALVETFCRLLIPGVLPMIWGLVLQKHMQTQNAVGPPALVAGLTIGFSIVANYFGVQWFGFDGVSMASTASRVFMCVSMGIAVIFYERSQGTKWFDPLTWRLFSSRFSTALSSPILKVMLALGIPGAFMMGLEAASFELTTAMAGYLGTEQVSAHASVFAIGCMAFICGPFGIALAATIRVGNLLGQGDAAAARLSGWVSIALGTSFMAVIGALMYAYKDSIGYLFTKDDDVMVAMLATIVPLASVYQAMNGALGCASGVLRGMGRQEQLMVFNFVGFWGVGVLSGFLLTFHYGLGLVGLWSGITAGVTVVMSLNVGLVVLVNWESEVANARKAAIEEERSEPSTRTLTISSSIRRTVVDVAATYHGPVYINPHSRSSYAPISPMGTPPTAGPDIMVHQQQDEEQL
ncbi:hypothetical protein CEUSTIGMA_g13369.t1 [Chlamydomonas eustigma]|uniref:Protein DETOXIFICATION n=1 Tax=Chlamydomonas eustigma TaxID=1157962 RepID=A0A250XSF2_9CHLO|nr:hypothetical protein CEUSTIGMA_g13369.t1 [Chlamydomonas eustigma]|eukprot:GAX85953.1 hypothetical protein CEUSTIGMA_g13369.t1 [Chlamydomonas eustigma]